MLSPTIELLLSLQRPGGGFLCAQGMSQTLIPIFPAESQIILQLLPLGEDYANIVYNGIFDPGMVPLTFYAYLQYYGARAADAIIAQWGLEHEFNSFVVVSRSAPAQILIENRSPLDQFYAGALFLVTIATEEDYHRILEALASIGALETNKLLRQLTTRLPTYPSSSPDGGS